MDYLLDTHTFIWFINGRELPNGVVGIISDVDNKIFLSIASVWEIAIKFSLGKLFLNESFERIEEFLENNYIELLPIKISHTEQLLKLPKIHNDPFDRIIVSQALIEDFTIITKDRQFANYDIKAVW